MVEGKVWYDKRRKTYVITTSNGSYNEKALEHDVRVYPQNVNVYRWIKMLERIKLHKTLIKTLKDKINE